MWVKIMKEINCNVLLIDYSGFSDYMEYLYVDNAGQLHPYTVINWILIIFYQYKDDLLLKNKTPKDNVYWEY